MHTDALASCKRKAKTLAYIARALKMIRIALNEKMLAIPVARHRIMATTPVLNIQSS